MFALFGVVYDPLRTARPEVALVELVVHFCLFAWERGVVLRT